MISFSTLPRSWCRPDCSGWVVNFGGFPVRWIVWITVFLCSSIGCSVKGFPQLEGTFHTPQQLRSAAAIATAQGRALTEIADQQQGMITSMLETAQGVAAGVGAPAVLTGLLGAAGGFLVPTPGQRRRQQLAKQEGEIAAKKSEQAGSG